MTKDELQALLRAHEDNFVERKPGSPKAAEIRATICAFANTVEGRDAVLFIGIGDRGTVIGVTDTDATQRQINQYLDQCYPPIARSFAVVQAEGKHIVAVIVPPSNNRPHFSGPAFVRVGPESRKASPQQFEELILSRNDKRRQILRHKGKGLITVQGIGYKLLAKESVADTRYREYLECLIEDCTAYDVKFSAHAMGMTFTASLTGIVLGRDDKHLDRFMIQVYPPRP